MPSLIQLTLTPTGIHNPNHHRSGMNSMFSPIRFPSNNTPNSCRTMLETWRKNGYPYKLSKNQNISDHKILHPKVLGHQEKQVTLIIAYTKMLQSIFASKGSFQDNRQKCKQHMCSGIICGLKNNLANIFLSNLRRLRS